MNRHRGAKPERRCELLTPISLLSPAYLLSVERWPFHSEPPDHYVLLSYLLDSLVSQLTWFMSLHSMEDFQTSCAKLRETSLHRRSQLYDDDPAPDRRNPRARFWTGRRSGPLTSQSQRLSSAHRYS